MLGLKRLLILGPFVAALTSGCKTNSNVEYNHDVDFTRYRTFTVAPPIIEGSPSDAAIARGMITPARDAVTETLNSKGFAAGTPESADLLVKVQAHFMGEAQPKQEDQTHERRTLTIDILDNKTQQVIWSRWRRRVTNQPIGSVPIREIIANMLKPFPPGGGAGPRPNATVNATF